MTDVIRYSAVYDHVRQQLRHQRERVASFVLDVLAEHADEWGCCYPGIGRIANETGYSDPTVQAALLRLEQLGYIRIDVTQNPRRSRPSVDYQLSPAVIALKPECQLKALRLWNAAKSDSVVTAAVDSKLQKPEIVIKESQQESEQESKQPTGTNSRTTTTTKTGPQMLTDALKQRESAEPIGFSQDDPENAENSAQREKTATAEQAQAETASANAQTPPSSAAPPTPEIAASIQRIKAQIPAMASKTARELVEKHGVETVDAALALLSQQNAKNPAGLFTFYLRRNIAAAADLTEPISPYLTGKYADLLEH